MAQVVARPASIRAPVDAGAPADGQPSDQVTAAHASLPLVALVLGIAGVVLGVTVIWFFAAIPVGIVSVATGIVARRRVATPHDERAASRATIGTALGCVAILLGITGAYFLQRVVDRALAALDRSTHDEDATLHSTIGGLDERITRIEQKLGL